jgi:DNA-binding beta-propeller fold protein YncE
VESRPVGVTIDKAGTQAYVSDLAANDVQVLTYPGGSIVATLGRTNGILTPPLWAVDSENYVP